MVISRVDVTVNTFLSRLPTTFVRDVSQLFTLTVIPPEEVDVISRSYSVHVKENLRR